MSLNLYPAVDEDTTRDVASSEIDEICQAIHDAMKGFGTNEKALLQALTTPSQEDRYKIPIRYEQLFEKNLYSAVKSEVGSRPFGVTLQYLALNPVEAEAEIIHNACKGLGTNEFLLTTVIAGRSNEEIDILKKTFFDRYSKDLGSVVAAEVKGHFEQLLLNALQGLEEEYDEDTYNDERMKEDIAKLHKMGIGKFGLDEKGIFKFLISSPPEYLKKINIAFAEDSGYTLGKALEKELNGDTEAAASFLLGIKINPYEQAAKLIEKATAGFGSNETLLQATLVRYQGIINDVKLKFVDLYGKTIQDRIRSECGGDYEKLLLLIVGEE